MPKIYVLTMMIFYEKIMNFINNLILPVTLIIDNIYANIYILLKHNFICCYFFMRC